MMKRNAWLWGVTFCSVASLAHAGAVVNGGFEAGLSSWTTVNQIGGDGTFFIQSGTASPLNGTPVPAPPGGAFAAMSDSQGPGTHILYQNVTVAAPVPSALLVFDVFVGNRANAFFTPNTLDFSTSALNQQARVDILLGSADPFSVLPADVLINAFRTSVGDPLVSGYTHYSVDVTSVINAHLNTPLMIRFAETDNVFTFQLGVDNVDLVPEPASCFIMMAGFVALVRRRVWEMVRAGSSFIWRIVGNDSAKEIMIEFGFRAPARTERCAGAEASKIQNLAC
jgi:hypothetical protein